MFFASLKIANISAILQFLMSWRRVGARCLNNCLVSVLKMLHYCNVDNFRVGSRIESLPIEYSLIRRYFILGTKNTRPMQWNACFDPVYLYTGFTSDRWLQRFRVNGALFLFRLGERQFTSLVIDEHRERATFCPYNFPCDGMFVRPAKDQVFSHNPKIAIRFLVVTGAPISPGWD